MAKIVFDKQGEHVYETGISKGVLYVKDELGKGYENGVAWNGLSSISESPEGAEETAIYADNVKYLSLRSIEEFKGTIEAYTYPDEWEACDGSAEFGAAGVKMSQQSRRSFCLSYQTKVGNDVNSEAGYKIHLVYGATAAPSEKSYETVNDSPEAITFSWEFSTIAIVYEGHNIAHIEIDSTKIDPEKLKKIEDALYGTDDTEPHILLPEELMEILRDEPVPPVLDHIEAALRDPTAKYQVGDTIALDNFVVTAFYDDGTSTEVKDPKCNVVLPYTFVTEDVAEGKSFTFSVEDKEFELVVPVAE